jgi:DNA-binding transcriptional ArsR family regulator
LCDVSSDVIELRNPGQMRALAHPVRIRVLSRLQLEGPATATQLAAEIGESVASLSYHLRQLARHGFIEEVPERRRSRRERWWRARALGEHFPRDRYEAPERRAAAAALTAQLVDAAAQRYYTFLDELEAYPVEWRSVALYLGQRVHVTPDELEEIGRKLWAVMEPYSRLDPADRPAGSRRVDISIQGVPTREP